MLWLLISFFPHLRMPFRSLYLPISSPPSPLYLSSLFSLCRQTFFFSRVHMEAPISKVYKLLSQSSGERTVSLSWLWFQKSPGRTLMDSLSFVSYPQGKMLWMPVWRTNSSSCSHSSSDGTLGDQWGIIRKQEIETRFWRLQVQPEYLTITFSMKCCFQKNNLP